MSDLAQSRFYYSARFSGNQVMRSDLNTLKTLFDRISAPQQKDYHDWNG